MTIFGCTWVAVHPNIPDAEETWFTGGLRRLQLMVIAVIAPEMVIMWALRQWLAAHKLAKKYKSVFVFSSGLSNKLTGIRYPQNTNGHRLMVFLL